MKRTLSEIKEELRNNLSLASTNDLVKYYDIISGASFSTKIKSHLVNENKYLDKKLRQTLFSLIKECNTDQAKVLYKAILNEDIYDVKAENKNSRKFQTKLDTLTTNIDKEYNLVDFDFDNSRYILTLDIAETPDHPWMDIMEYIYDNFIDGGDEDWKYLGHSGGVVTLQWIGEKKEQKEIEQKAQEDDLEYDSYGKDKQEFTDLKEKDIKDPSEQPKD
jgi:hypothetical protein